MAEIYYTVTPHLHRMSRIEGKEVVSLDFEIPEKPLSLLHSVFLGRVVEVQKPIQAAFVDIGLSKPGLLPLKEGNLAFAKHGDSVLVQVVRAENPLEDKGVRLTRLITLSLGSLLYTPFKSGLNFSKRLKSKETFKDLLSLDADEGVIIRNGAVTDDPLQQTLNQLRHEWQMIQSQLSKKPPLLLGGQHDLLTRLLRSLRAQDKLFTDDRHIVKLSKERALYTRGKAFDDGSEEAWESLHHPQVSLINGGNIYIEETHAMVVIDVNSQGALSHALPFNRKVMREVLRQIRLRDLGGKIVIDLIHPPKNWKTLFPEHDIPSDVQIWGISAMGLLEMIRQKRRLSLPERLKLHLN